MAKTKKAATADVSELAVLRTIKELKNCSMANLHDRLVRGKPGATMLGLGRIRDSLLAAGHIEKIGHFVHCITQAGEDEIVRLETAKKAELQPA